MDSGIEIVMISVLRQLPRNSSTMSAVRAAAITPPVTTPLHRGPHEHGLIAGRRRLSRPSGSSSRTLRQARP